MADNINVVVETGRLTKAAELKYPREGFAVVNFTIAVNESKKKGDEWIQYPNYFDVTFTGNYAAAIVNSLSKGREVTVSGELHQDRWEKDGQKYSKVIIRANNVAPGRPPKGESDSSAPAYSQSEPPESEPDFQQQQYDDEGNPIPF